MTTSEHAQPSDHWSNLSRVLSLMGPPLRPPAEDTAITERFVREWASAHGSPRVLMMGVTNELYAIDWPAGTHITAMDNNRDMIEYVWPGPRDSALCCDWRSMCVADASFQIAVCDGGLIMVPFPHDTRLIARELARVLRPGGLFVTRLYAPPAVPETVGSVLDDLVARRIPSVNHLKIRLWMALQRSGSEGVAVRDVWSALATISEDVDELARATGWSPDELRTIAAYRESAFRYYLPAAEEVVRLFTDEDGAFEFVALACSEYPLADRCPTLVLRRR